MGVHDDEGGVDGDETGEDDGGDDDAVVLDKRPGREQRDDDHEGDDHDNRKVHDDTLSYTRQLSEPAQDVPQQFSSRAPNH